MVAGAGTGRTKAGELVPLGRAAFMGRDRAVGEDARGHGRIIAAMPEEPSHPGAASNKGLDAPPDVAASASKHGVSRPAPVSRPLRFLVARGHRGRIPTQERRRTRKDAAAAL